MNIKDIQAYLKEHRLDGWLIADFHGRNDIAVKMLELKGMLTRRAFYYIPADSEPSALVNPIEQEKFRHLPGQLIPCFGYKNLESVLRKTLSGAKRLAMEYSPMGRLPYIGLVDAGTVELVRDMDIEIISSADLVAHFQARLTVSQIASHREAAAHLVRIKDKAFDYIRQSLIDNEDIGEYDVCRFILDLFKQAHLQTDSGPNCSVDSNAGNPHYEPSPDSHKAIRKGQLILIDLWAKNGADDAVYGDITWMAYSGTADEIPDEYNKIFEILTSARDRAVAFLKEEFPKRPVYGYEVDDACREVVQKAGYGEYFTHRTGHSITSAEHGTGPNIDNLETEDRRLLQPGHLFSVEPGIYLKHAGLRTEIDVLITEVGPEVTTLPLQETILPLF